MCGYIVAPDEFSFCGANKTMNRTYISRSNEPIKIVYVVYRFRVHQLFSVFKLYNEQSLHHTNIDTIIDAPNDCLLRFIYECSVDGFDNIKLVGFQIKVHENSQRRHTLGECERVICLWFHVRLSSSEYEIHFQFQLNSLHFQHFIT